MTHENDLGGILRERFHFPALQQEDNVKNLKILAKSPSWSEGPPSKIVLDTLAEGVSFDASEDKDRVYGLLGMINKEESMKSMKKFSPLPNCRKSLSEVYQDVIKYALKLDSNLNTLCTYEPQPDRGMNIPSWAIDWRKKVTLSPLGHHAIWFGNIINPGSEHDPDGQFTENQHRLGNEIDTVTACDEVGKLKLKGHRIGTLYSLPQNATQIEATLPIEWQGKGRAQDLLSHGYPIGRIAFDEAVKMEYYGSRLGLDYPKADLRVIVPVTAANGDFFVSMYHSSGLNNTLYLLRPRGDGQFEFVGPIFMYAKERFASLFTLDHVKEGPCEGGRFQFSLGQERHFSLVLMSADHMAFNATYYVHSLPMTLTIS